MTGTVNDDLVSSIIKHISNNLLACDSYIFLRIEHRYDVFETYLSSNNLMCAFSHLTLSTDIIFIFSKNCFVL